MESLKSFLQDLLRLNHQPPVIQEEGEEDPRLANWLSGLGISEISQKKAIF